MKRFLRSIAGAVAAAFLAAPSLAENPMSVAMAPQFGVTDSLGGSGIADRRDWREYFQDISKGGIVISLDDRRLSYWSPGAERFMEFPVGVPRAEEFERTGRTAVVRKKVDPDWRPTADMRRRDPTLPVHMEAGPGNPLGTRAMYLGWPAYLIHGTNDPTTIGKKVSSGCFRMFPAHVELLYDWVQAGTPVYVY